MLVIAFCSALTSIVLGSTLVNYSVIELPRIPASFPKQGKSLSPDVVACGILSFLLALYATVVAFSNL